VASESVSLDYEQSQPENPYRKETRWFHNNWDGANRAIDAL